VILAFCVKPVKLIILVWIEFVQQHEEFISIHLFKYLAKTWRTQEEQRKYLNTRNLCSIKYIVGNKFSVHAQFTIYQFKNCHQQRKRIENPKCYHHKEYMYIHHQLGIFSHKPWNRLQITWWMGGEKSIKKTCKWFIIMTIEIASLYPNLKNVVCRRILLLSHWNICRHHFN
jgi:hypothetical protein